MSDFPQHVRCFLVEPTGLSRLSLRRYADGPCPLMPGEHGYHNASLPLFDADETRTWTVADVPPGYVFPTHCACGYAFDLSGIGQVMSDRLYANRDTGEVRTLRAWEREPGAMWNAKWLADHPFYRGTDGLSLHVVCPDGWPWAIDGPCSNCTQPGDSAHKCWVRHGVPPAITVDKDGVTCAAGAGSIQTPHYHGFLRGGVFEP